MTAARDTRDCGGSGREGGALHRKVPRRHGPATSGRKPTRAGRAGDRIQHASPKCLGHPEVGRVHSYDQPAQFGESALAPLLGKNGIQRRLPWSEEPVVLVLAVVLPQNPCLLYTSPSPR